ncbi:MAG: hypothetical protein O3A46_17590, partial [Candidatus Poribacteria bacterium]|nr:hypothetical protein [Candidatus Poribacteria bacterium]
MRETIIETWQSLNAALRDGTVLHDKIIPSVVVIFLVVGLRYALVKLVINRMEDQRAQYRWKKATSYAFSVLVVLLVGHFWSDAVGSLA